MNQKIKALLATMLMLPSFAMSQSLSMGTEKSQINSVATADLMLNVEGARTFDGSSLIKIDRNATPMRQKLAPVGSAGYIFANKTYMSTWSDYTRTGIYAIGIDDDFSQPVFVGDAINGSRGMCYFDQQLWITYVYQASILSSKYTYHYVFSFLDGSLIRAIDPGYLTSVSTTMAFDRYTGLLYGSFNSDDNQGQVFGTVDPVTGVRTELGKLPFALSAMAIDNNHRMWAMNRLTGVLYEVNMKTGALTPRGKTGLKSQYINSGCIDPITGTYYYTVCNLNDAGLYTIDLETAQATLVRNFPLNDEYVYMWMPTSLSDAVPAKPINLAANFEGEALEGTLSYKVPNKLANGMIENGTVTATVYLDGVAIDTREVNYGATVTLPVTVSENGMKYFGVALINDQGESQVARVSLKVGGDNLPAPTGLYMRTFTDTHAVRLYWDAYPGENVTYDVTRYPDGIQVATGLTSAYYREVPPQDQGRKSYSYGVRAHVDGKLTEEARSETVVAGNSSLPYNNKFENRDRFNELTYINANGDEYVWSYAVNLDYQGAHGIYMPYNARELTWYEQMQGIEPESDDWAVTPGLPLEAGKIYTVTYKMSTKGGDETYEVKMGTNPTVGSMTTTIIPRSIVPSAVLPVYRQDYSKSFTVNADGTYFIGLHCMSAGGFWLCVYEINVSEGYLPDAPAAPAIAVTSDENGELMANVSVTAPTKTMQNGTLQAIDHIDVVLDENVVHTWQNPTPGETLTAQVPVPRLGEYEFEALGYSTASEHGEAGKVTAFIGAKAPSDVASASITETANLGEVTISWPAVTTATDGTAIDPALVNYTLYDTNGDIVTQVEGDTAVTFRAGPADDQTLVRYYVGSKLGDRTCFATAFTPYAVVGKPYALPYYETTDNAQFKYFWLISGACQWTMQPDASDIQSYDGDGSFLYMRGQYIDDWGALTSGKINLTGRDITLDLAYMTLQNDSNTLAVNVVCDGVTNNLTTVTLHEATSEDWTWKPLQLSLDQYAGKTVQIQLVGTLKTHAQVFVDAVKITSTVDAVRGDLNGDGLVDVTDVSLLIDVVLGKDVQVADGAITDLNGDGNVDVTDVSMLIDIVLGK